MRLTHLSFDSSQPAMEVGRLDQMSSYLATHYDDVIMSAIASQITSLTVVYSTVYWDQSKHQSSTLLAFVWGIHRDRWIPRTKGQLRGKCFHLMASLWFGSFLWHFRQKCLETGIIHSCLLAAIQHACKLFPLTTAITLEQFRLA